MELLQRDSSVALRAQLWGKRGFSLAELLVVIGVIALLLAIIVSPLQMARRQAMATRCAAQQKDIGIALVNAKNDYSCYPLWDDGGSPQRYTWTDVLVELGLLTNVKVAYCPEDPQPSALNSARARHYNVLYPGRENRYGIDYSYGIGMPLSAGGQNWRPGLGPPGDNRPRRFDGSERYTAQRVLTADANWSLIYNLSSGDTWDWSYPTQYDNMVAYRHANRSANFLFQDAHVARVRYVAEADEPLNTSAVCLWYPGEPVNVGPEDEFQGNWYPDVPPIDGQNLGRGPIPWEVIPRYYTDNLLWTQIYHK